MHLSAWRCSTNHKGVSVPSRKPPINRFAALLPQRFWSSFRATNGSLRGPKLRAAAVVHKPLPSTHPQNRGFPAHHKMMAELSARFFLRTPAAAGCGAMCTTATGYGRAASLHGATAWRAIYDIPSTAKDKPGIPTIRLSGGRSFASRDDDMTTDTPQVKYIQKSRANVTIPTTRLKPLGAR